MLSRPCYYIEVFFQRFHAMLDAIFHWDFYTVSHTVAHVTIQALSDDGIAPRHASVASLNVTGAQAGFCAHDAHIWTRTLMHSKRCLEHVS
jgi:hypothetical protein